MPTTDEKHKYEEASRLILIKKWNAALPLLLDLIQTSKYYDSQDQTHYLLGLCYRFTYQIDKAIKSLEKCVGLVRFDEDPMYGSYYLALGIAYQQDGQYARAIDTFALGVQKDPNNHLIDNSIGLTFRLMGNYDRASQAYNHAHQILIDNALETLNIEPLSTDPEERQTQFTDLFESGKLTPVLASNLTFSIVCHNIGQIEILLDNPWGAVLAFRDSISHIPEGEKYDLPREALENLLETNTDESGRFRL